MKHYKTAYIGRFLVCFTCNVYIRKAAWAFAVEVIKVGVEGIDDDDSLEFAYLGGFYKLCVVAHET